MNAGSVEKQRLDSETERVKLSLLLLFSVLMLAQSIQYKILKLKKV